MKSIMQFLSYWGNYVCFVEGQINPFRWLSRFSLTWEFILPWGEAGITKLHLIP